MTPQLNVPDRAKSPRTLRARRGLRFAWLSLAWTLVAIFFIAGALLLVVRYVAMPRVDHLRPRIEQMASRAVKAQVTIGRIDASWLGLNPHLVLRDVRVASGSDRPCVQTRPRAIARTAARYRARFRYTPQYP